MIEFLNQRIAGAESNESKINILRESLQLLALKAISDKNYFGNVAFVGGTALRFLYDLRRFSEDLDFSLVNKERYDFESMISDLSREFRLSGLEIKADSKISKTVQSCMVKFPGLLKSMGLSPFEGQNISIKIEVDTNPPAGWQIKETLINKIYVLNITHFDLPSSYAAKLHACFFRRYTKGRDFYDLAWYLGKSIKPNYELLNNAIRQTQGGAPSLDDAGIREFLLEKLEKIEFKVIKKDVEKFLENKNELKLLEKSVLSENITRVFV